jgi:PIN domain nuclease of toxin-antitoxin system
MLLLDTSVVLSVVQDLDGLGAQGRRRISERTVVHVSSVSVVEIVIKTMTGKLRSPDDLLARFAQQGLVGLPLTSEHAVELAAFPELARHDPFDRLLVAQAYQTGMDFLTANRALLSLGRDFIVDARL